MKKSLILFIDEGDKAFKRLYSFAVKQTLDEFSLTANLGPKVFKHIISLIILFST
jgi:hypothetical protein